MIDASRLPYLKLVNRQFVPLELLSAINLTIERRFDSTDSLSPRYANVTRLRIDDGGGHSMASSHFAPSPSSAILVRIACSLPAYRTAPQQLVHKARMAGIDLFQSLGLGVKKAMARAVMRHHSPSLRLRGSTTHTLGADHIKGTFTVFLMRSKPPHIFILFFQSFCLWAVGRQLRGIASGTQLSRRGCWLWAVALQSAR